MRTRARKQRQRRGFLTAETANDGGCSAVVALHIPRRRQSTEERTMIPAHHSAAASQTFRSSHPSRVDDSEPVLRTSTVPLICPTRTSRLRRSRT